MLRDDGHFFPPNLGALFPNGAPSFSAVVLPNWRHAYPNGRRGNDSPVRTWRDQPVRVPTTGTESCRTLALVQLVEQVAQADRRLRLVEEIIRVGRLPVTV
jgi:hypothetical protein